MVFKNEILRHDSIHLKRKVKKLQWIITEKNPYKYFSERVAMVTGILQFGLWADKLHKDTQWHGVIDVKQRLHWTWWRFGELLSFLFWIDKHFLMRSKF